MENSHIPLHLIRELRRGTKQNRTWASFLARTKAGGQATIVFMGTVPRPNATGEYVAVRASCKRTDNGTWFIFSDAVVAREIAQRSNEAVLPERRDSMTIAAARTALRIALKALDEGGALGAEEAHVYTSHACDSLRSYLDLHGIGEYAPQQFEDDDDDFDVVPYADWQQPEEAA